MTDKEIIKALECCVNKFDGWVRYNDGNQIHKVTIADILDVINRQQAEIERLEIKIEGVQEANAILREHIKKAVKEFAERLKESKIDIDVSFGYGREVYTEAVAVVEIDNLVKEMVGENNE